MSYDPSMNRLMDQFRDAEGAKKAAEAAAQVKAGSNSFNNITELPPYDPNPAGPERDKAIDLLSRKKDITRAATLAKQERMNPGAVAKHIESMGFMEVEQLYGKEGLERKQQQNLALDMEKWAENEESGVLNHARDLPLSFLRVGTKIAGSLSAVATKGVGLAADAYRQAMSPGGLIDPIDNSPGVFDNLANQAIGHISDATSGVDDWLRSGQSKVANRNEDSVGRKTQARQAENAIQENEELRTGAHPVEAGLRRIGRDVVDVGAETLDNKTHLLNTAFGELATLPLAALGKVGTAARATGVISKRVGKEIAEEGVEGNFNRLARDRIEASAALRGEVAELANKKAVTQAAGVIAATESSSVYQSTHDRVMAMDPSQFESDPYYQEVTKTDGKEAAHRAMAAKAAGRAMLIAAPISAVAGRIAAPFELAPLATGVAGGVRRQSTEAGLNVLREVGEEFIQGAGGTLAENLGVKTSGVDPDADLLAGVGGAAGAGAVTAAAMSGGVQAPGLAWGVTKATAGSVKDNITSLGNVLADHTESKRAAAATVASQAASAAAGARFTALQASHPEVAATISTGLPPATVETSASFAALAPEDRIEAQEGETSFQTMFKQASAYVAKQGSDTAAINVEMDTVTASHLRNLRDVLPTLEAAFDALPEGDPQRTPLAENIIAYSELTESEGAAAVIRRFSNLSTATKTKIETDLVSGTPAVKAAASEHVIETVSIAPDQVTPTSAGVTLSMNSDLSPKVRSSLESIVQQGAIEGQAKAARDALINASTTPEKVRKSINYLGNAKNGKLSIKDHVKGILRASATNSDSLEDLGTKFHKFAYDLGTRARLFAETAERLENDGANSMDVPGTRQLSDSNAPFVLHRGNPNSMAIVEASRIDAVEAVQAYNDMVKLLPKGTKLKLITPKLVPGGLPSVSTTSAPPTSPDDVTPPDPNKEKWDKKKKEALDRAAKRRADEEAQKKKDEDTVVEDDDADILVPNKKTKAPRHLLQRVAKIGLNQESFRKAGISPDYFRKDGGFPFLFRATGGLTPHTLREYLEQEGFFPFEDPNAPSEIGDSDAVEMLDNALRGEQVYSYEDQQQVKEDQQNEREETGRNSILEFIDRAARGRPMSETKLAGFATKLLAHLNVDAAVTVRYVDSGNRAGMLEKQDDGSYVVNLRRTLRGPLALTTLARELGHIIKHEAIDDQDNPGQKAIVDEYNAWVASKKGKGETIDQAWLSRAPTAIQKLLADKGSTASRVMKRADADKVLSFDEWFADQVARYMTTDKTSLTVVGKFFSGVATKLRKLALLFAGNAEPAAAVKTFLDGMRDSHRAVKPEVLAREEAAQDREFEDTGAPMDMSEDDRDFAYADEYADRFEEDAFGDTGDQVEELEGEPEPDLEVLPATTTAERFSGLVDQAADASVTDDLAKRARKNQFVANFNVDKGSRSLLARLGSDVLSKLAAAASRGMAGLRPLMPKESKSRFKSSEIKWISELSTKVLPAFIEKMQERLKTNFAEAHPKGGNVQWLRADSWSLHATNANWDDIKYDPSVIEAVALATFQWAMDTVERPPVADDEFIAGLLKIDVADLTDEMRAPFLEGTLSSVYIRTLASNIMQQMGVRAKTDAPINITDGIAKSLAIEAIETLVAQGYLFHPNTTPVGDQTMTFLAWDQDLETNTTNNMLKLKKGLGTGLDNFNKLVDPSAPQDWHIGKPSENIKEKFTGSKQKLTEQGINAEKNHHNIVFKFNMPFLLRVTGMTEIQQLKYFGYNDIAKDQVNRVEWEQIQSVNTGIRRALHDLKSMVNHASRYGDENGLDIKDVPVFFDWHQFPNGRLFMKGIGPQANKIFREMLTPVTVTLDMKNEEHIRDFKLSIAQALGVKTEMLTHDAALAKMEEFFGDKEHVFAKAVAMLQNSEADPSEVFEAVMAGVSSKEFEVTERGVNALHTYAEYLTAVQNKEATFTQAIAFELDGKTDGPAHAISQFGLTGMDERTLLNLARAGFFFNQDGDQTLNEFYTDGRDPDGNKHVDLYGAASGNFAKILPKIRSKENLQHIDEFKPGLLATEHIFLAIGQFAMEKGVLTVKRAFAKGPVTKLGYGAGLKALVNELTGTMTDFLYKELSKAIQEDRQIPVELQNAFNALITHEIVWNKDKQAFFVTKVSDPIDFTKTGAYQSLELSPQHLKAMKSHLKQGYAKALKMAVDEEMGATMKTMAVIIDTTKIQWAVLKHEYDKAYEALRLKRVAAKEIFGNSSLSQEDEQAIIKSLAHLNPVLQTSYTEEGQSREYGMGMLENSREGLWETPTGKTNKDGTPVMNERKVSSMGNSRSGKLHASINKAVFRDPGVRASPMFNIAIGDSAMMSNFFQAMNQALNVWDGLEIGVGTISENGYKINEAVYGALEYDALGAVNQNFQRAVKALGKSIKENPELDKQIKKMLDPFDSQSLNGFNFLEINAMKLQEMADETLAMKQALLETGISVDHMAGSMRPFTKKGIVHLGKNGKKATMAELADILNTRAGEILAEMQKNKKDITEGADPTLVKLIQTISDKGKMGKNQIRSVMDRHKFNNKIQEYVWGKIKNMIPDNIVMYVGSPAQILKLQQGMGLNVSPNGKVDAGSLHKNMAFISVASPETMMHELVHATTYHLIRMAFEGTLKLSPAQMKAIKTLSLLTKEFAKLVSDTESLEVESAMWLAQREVNKYLAEGKMPEAISEFMAWSMNQNVQKVLGRTIPERLLKIINRVMAAVRQLLGLSDNVPMNTWLGQALSSITVLTKNAPTVQLPTTGTAESLSQNTNPNSGVEHVENVSSIYKLFQDRIREVYDLQDGESNTTPFDGGGQDISSVIEAFDEAGFNFSELENATFATIQQIMSMTMKHDPRAMNLAQEFYEHVMSQLTVEKFMDDPETSDPSARPTAQLKLEAVQGKGTVALNSKGQNNLLANFLSLAIVSEEFRDILDGIGLPKGAKFDKNPDGVVRKVATIGFDLIGSVGYGINKSSSVRVAIDQLAQKLFQSQANTNSRKALDLVGKGNALAVRGVSAVGNAAAKVATSLPRGQTGVKGHIITGVGLIMKAAAGMTTKEGADVASEQIVRTANSDVLWGWLNKLMIEARGTQDDNRALHGIVDQVSYAVSTIRQKLREQLPPFVRGKFTLEMDKKEWKKTWKVLYRSVARADIQSLLGSFDLAKIKQLFTDDKYRKAEIASREAELRNLRFGSKYIDQAKALGHYMATNDNPKTVQMLLRNAKAISHLGNQVGVVKDAAIAEPILDELISLYAIQALSASERATTAKVMEDTAGTDFLVGYLRDLNKREQGKSQDQEWNRWKGFAPTSFDPRKRLVLADALEADVMARRGYKMVGLYSGDSADKAQLAYYATTSGGEATYNQGALLTTEKSVGGVDYKTGRTLDMSMGSMITNPFVVNSITRSKKGRVTSGGIGLMPIFGQDGSIVAYERPLEASMRDRFLNQHDDLAETIGMWEGRIREEELAQQFNQGTVAQLHKDWERDKVGKSDEFVAINQSNQKTIQTAWAAMPRETQDYFIDQFRETPEQKDEDVKVMVRRDMADNAVGYRAASVSDIFTENSDLKPEVRRAIEGFATFAMGKNAYKYTVNTERFVQGVVSTAKNMIVVRSLTVGWVNGLSNQLQALSLGVPIKDLITKQTQALSEVNTYRRNLRLLNELHADQYVEKDSVKLAEINRKIQSYLAANKRMMIWPLIESGQLPSISEGLSEQDEFSLMGDLAGWLEEKTDALPPALLTSARWAVVAKGTPIYEGLNLFIQYGDFVAKAAVYHHLTINQKMDADQAMLRVSEEFVNYNLLAGRSRDYLESVGVTWFANYKIRIQKIWMRHLRENPLRLLMTTTGADLVGTSSLMDATIWNIDYGMFTGWDQLWRASGSLWWRQLLSV